MRYHIAADCCYKSHRREDRVRKANIASQLRTQRERERDVGRESETARKETETGGVKRIWGS